ncbi:helix-turn-helix transcriptional regulator [Actinomadura roseirufa]|uniref:helix-turn-helix transcriptional regulator n=1 Tax=Actinomadura roseirufa TaxID=2094049 RepID=UPI0010417F88|nr:LuxR C-terminal-related transcriptional regulator [Actinomadura roseirufa]
MLNALGLERSTETVYRLLLEHPSWGLDELAGHLGWDAPRTRIALDALADLHLLSKSADVPGTLRVVSPRVALVSLLAREEAELATRQRVIDVTRSAVRDLVDRYGHDSHDLETVERIEGLDAVRGRLAELAERAERECLSFLPGGPPDTETMQASGPLDEEALARGVLIRSIYQESFRNDPACLRYVRRLALLGGETRTVPSLPTLLVIVDRESALVPLDPEDGRRGALLLRGPGLVTPLAMLFEKFWQDATPWESRPAADGNGVSPQERELLGLLASGHTDESASRVLGVSVRTARRMMSDLMDRLGAQSRFEAGVRATQRGWLTGLAG